MTARETLNPNFDKLHICQNQEEVAAKSANFMHFCSSSSRPTFLPHVFFLIIILSFEGEQPL